MIEILQRLIDLITAWITYLLPWAILGDDQVGLIRRLGKYKRDMKHGWNWKCPIIEVPLTETSSLDSAGLSEQSLTTQDEKQVTLRGVITYRIINPRKYILGCDSPTSIMNDVGCCVIAEIVPEFTSDMILSNAPAFQRALLSGVCRRAKKWGVKIDSVGIVDCVQASTIRLISSRTPGVPPS